MARKNQKVVKTIKKIAEEIEDVGINDSGAWHKLGRELEGILTAVPKKSKDIRELLDLVHAGLKTMSAQTANDPLALVDAVWQGLNSAEQCLSGRPGSEEQIAGIRQKLEDTINLPPPSVTDAPSVESGNYPLPLIESLDDAAALLIQLEPDNQAELMHLRASLFEMIPDGGDGQDRGDLIAQAADKISEIVEGRAADPDQAISRAGALLEKAMNPTDDVGVTAESSNELSDASTEAAVGGPPEDNSDFDHMPRDADAELIAEFIAEGSDLISSAEEALLSLETDPEDMESVGKVFRAFHTVKGTSAFLELNLLSRFGHHAESLLSRVRDGEIRYSGGYADLSLRALD
ncbi:MAG: Hpt domain-containing protein, partial [Desulfobacterales bacterium]